MRLNGEILIGKLGRKIEELEEFKTKSIEKLKKYQENITILYNFA